MDDAKETRNLINWFHADPKADEIRARRFLTSLLRTTQPLDLGVRWALGDLFDPGRSQEHGCYFIIKRGRGNHTKTVNIGGIALCADPRADSDQARYLLAKLLHATRPLDPGVRFALADLFDPDLRSKRGYHLTIKRVRGNRTKMLATGKIAQYVWQATRKGQPLKNAVTDAAEKFGCDNRTLREFWSLHKPLYDKYPEMGWGAIPPKDWPK
jgi:hypothetical protein